MTPDEIIGVWIDPEWEGLFDSQEGLVIDDIKQGDQHVSIGESSVFRVEAVYFPINRSISPIDVKSSDGNDLGLLLLLKGQEVGSFSELSLSEFLAYLVEVPISNLGILPYIFESDYFVASDNRGQEYREGYYDSAPIWGQFTHAPMPVIAQRTVPSIVAIDRIALPSLHHHEAFSRYVHSINPLERYLRLYHCVELLFDAVVVLKIKGLGPDIRDFSTIMADHGKSELERLKAIAKGFITDHEKLASFFPVLSNFEQIALKVFQDFSKDGNPVNPKDHNARWGRLIQKLQAGQYLNSDIDTSIRVQEPYSDFVAKLAAYWIYRVRCSIAHSRVGEYILEDRDHAFVTEFAEPLLLEFVRQVFTAQGLHDLL